MQRADMKIASTEKNHVEFMRDLPGRERELALSYVGLGERLAELLATKLFGGLSVVLVVAMALAAGIGFFSATPEEMITKASPPQANWQPRFQDPRESD